MLFCEPCASYVCKIKFTQDDLEEFENTLRLCASARDCIKLHFLRALRLCVMQLISTNAQKLSPIAACSPANCGLFFLLRLLCVSAPLREIAFYLYFLRALRLPVMQFNLHSIASSVMNCEYSNHF